MSAELLISRAREESRAALVQDGHLTDYRVSTAARPSLVGGIFRGRLHKRLKALNAAIVHVPGASVWVDLGRSSLKPAEGGIVTLQVLQDPFDGKQPRATLEPALAGRFLAYLPLARRPALSHRLRDETARSLLGNQLTRLSKAGTGSFLALRRAATAAAEMIAREAAQLRSVWDSSTARSKDAAPPVVQIAPPDAAFDLLRTSVGEGLSRIVVDGEPLAGDVRDWLAEWAPEWRGKVERAPAAIPLLGKPEIEEQLAAALGREVAVPAGGALIFESAAGVSVIDVDSDRMAPDGPVALDFARLNAAAARVIARQIRLRNLGGRIVIDFAGSHKPRSLAQAMHALRAGVADDPMGVRIAGPSELGLVELVRRRERLPLAAMLAASR